MNTTPQKPTRLTIALHIVTWVLLALIALAFVTGMWNDAGATPNDIPNTQHWQLLVTDDAWLITEPGCNLQTTQYGGSYHFECVEGLDSK